MRFGTFIAPHHPVGEHPTLQFERDLQMCELFDRLGYDEVWVGEHHSGGWETIGHPEMFLAAAAQRTNHIMLATGVVSLPYHHPYNVAGRIAHLDHLPLGVGIARKGWLTAENVINTLPLKAVKAVLARKRSHLSG